MILNELITFTSTKQMENWTNYCNACFKCFRLLFSEGMTAVQKVGGWDVTLVFGPNRCCVLSTAPFKSAKHFLAEPYLYHQVFIRIKRIALKWVMVLRGIGPYKGMWEAHDLSVLTAAPPPAALHPPSSSNTHTHAHTSAAVGNNWFLTTSPIDGGLFTIDNTTLWYMFLQKR